MTSTIGVAATVGAMALLLAGCAVPAPKAPAAPRLPAHWQSEPGDGPTADWARLADPELQALLRQAEAANRDLVQAALRIEQARLQGRTADLRLTPSAGAAASLGRTLDPLTGPGAVTSRSVSANVGVGYEVDLWGRIAALREADEAQLRAARSDLRAARLLLRQKVAESYWQLASARRQAELAQAQLALNRDLLAATRLRVKEGQLLPIEVDRAAATLQQAEVRIADLQADSAQQRLQLALLLDQPPPGPAVAQPRLPGELPPRWRIGGDPATVLERRPDVQRARANVDAALARARATEAQRYPTLAFNAGVATGGAAVSDWLSHPIASLSGSLVVPLIDWRRLDLQREAARTDLELAALALREAVARALVEIENALIDGERLQRQLEANATRLREAEAAERVAALRLEVGTIARADLLQARNARMEAEQGRLQLQLRAWLNRLQLAQALALE